MATSIDHPHLIRQVLENHAAYRNQLPDGYGCQTVFDDERGQYLLVDIGWNGDRDLHATPIHIGLIDGKVWIQSDETEEGIASDLVEAGIPKEDIVLGFRHPKVRPYTGFAVSSS